MVRISSFDKYLRPEAIGNGTLLIIASEGEYISAEESFLGRAVFQIEVQLGNDLKTWTMNKTTQRNLAKAYGDETRNWIGRKVRIELTKMNIRGESKNVMLGYPVTERPASTATEEP